MDLTRAVPMLGGNLDTRCPAVALAVIRALPALAQNESEARENFFDGADLVDAGEYLGAIDVLEEALELDPNLCSAHYPDGDGGRFSLVPGPVTTEVIHF